MTSDGKLATARGEGHERAYEEFSNAMPLSEVVKPLRERAQGFYVIFRCVGRSPTEKRLRENARTAGNLVQLQTVLRAPCGRLAPCDLSMGCMTPDEAPRVPHRPFCALSLRNPLYFKASRVFDWLTIDEGVIGRWFFNGLQHAQGVLSKILSQDEV